MAPKATSSERRLSARRKAARLRLRIFLGILFVLIVAGAFYLLWQPYARIAQVTVNDGDASLEALAESQMVGSYLHIIPRDSYFFIPKAAMRSAILAAHPELESVSISRSGLKGLAITVAKRVPLARWCGGAVVGDAADTLVLDTVPTIDGSCYLFDATGYLYATATPPEATTTDPSMTPLSDLLMYSSTTAAATSTSPISASVANSSSVPAVLEFARSLGSLGATPRAVVIRGDEVDLFLARAAGTSTDALGTRVTYVLGDEQGAFSLASSAFPQLNLTDGSVEYVDLRFSASGRVYLKKTKE